MKFGRDFHVHQVPAWTAEYIDYNGVKEWIKSSNPEDRVLTAATLGLPHVENFLSKQLDVASKWAKDITNRFGIDTTSPHYPIPADVSRVEFLDLKQSLLEHSAFVAQLDSFSKVNRDAIRRLLGKPGVKDTVAQLKNEGKLLYSQPWLSILASTNVLLKEVEAAIALASNTPGNSSVLLNTFWPQTGGSIKGVLRGIASDDVGSIEPVYSLLATAPQGQAFRNALLQVAILHNSRNSVRSLLNLDLSGESPHGDYIHYFLAHWGRTLNSGANHSDFTGLLDAVIPESSAARPLLVTKDSRGRTPLHYAAALGLSNVCSRILAQIDSKYSLEPDDAGDTPLLLAVSSGHADVVQLFISTLDGQASGEAIGQSLVVAIESGHSDVAKILVRTKRGLDYPGKYNQTPLYVAARRGNIDVVEQLLDASANPSFKETSHLWTPLIVSAVQGHLSVAQKLASSGVLTLDKRGWSALDHAAYRGYPKIVNALADYDTGLASKDSNVSQKGAGAEVNKVPTRFPITGVLSDELSTSHLFVNLGSFDLYKTGPVINIEPYIKSISPKQLPKNNLDLYVSAAGSSEEYRVELPILEDLSNLPWHFPVSRADDAKVVFKITEHSPAEEIKGPLLFIGIALLDNLQKGLGANRETVARDYTIPLITPSGDYAGDLTFNFLLSHPIASSPTLPPPQSMKPLQPTQVGAHRGLGQNLKQKNHLQIGENTLESFDAAVKLGAAFIEVSLFDVQVTKDFVPVIYHDFLVSETGTDAQMHMLSYSQFMVLSDAQAAQYNDPPRRLPWDERDRPHTPQRRRAQSLSAPPEAGTQALFERIKHTFEFSNSGMKGNTRWDHIHSSFLTLKQMLTEIPESVPFDIELKYPMLFETDDWKMEPFAMELNKFLDTILTVLFQYGRQRSIFITSFSPELCIMLSTKQKVYPILFLNDSSNWPTGDPRALSLQSAVHFARRWGLGGVVMASEPYVSSPKLVKWTRDQGLFCATYGAQNDDPKFAKIQADAGIDAVIVNNVHLISKTLEESRQVGH
ncbi:uncharacterized protein F4822DRAFT_411372 [Hypoxylon trugodes]|uniref:uncharacterized protein n=1 Tax=Hypoxylon trugodes TaxID=326681 RepID=UPI002190BD25|nr:uncharacterized protein F4822DRAFT_411372 [Hypoxylon trugodes]KAI1386842.1 hypothetical protein F4822DRAFT_411372 [Hypoxylon trugodes]